MNKATLERLPLYVGGFMGPFGTIVITPMYPELEAEFDASLTAVSLGFSLYLLPFAVLLLVSGTLGERWGRRRTVRGTYVLFAVSSVIVALAPTLGIFIAGRVMQGVANAFITPLLLAGLAEAVPPERFGREVGIYSSFQALGGGLGPLLGGLAADVDWRLAFWGSALVAALLALAPPQGEPRPTTQRPSLRPLLNRRMLALGFGFFALATGPIGVGVLVAVQARSDQLLDLSGAVAGIVLLCGSAMAFVLGPLWGGLVDRFGTRRLGIAAVLAVSALAGLPSLADGPVLLAALWALTSSVTALVVVIFQNLGATIMPENRGGALSFLLSFRFVGHAVGPLLFLPFVEGAVRPTFFIAASLGVVTAVILAVLATQLDDRSGSTGTP